MRPMSIFTKPSREFTGQFCIDDKVLYASGVRDFERYRVDPMVPLMSDFFVPDDDVPPPGVTVRRCPRLAGRRSRARMTGLVLYATRGGKRVGWRKWIVRGWRRVGAGRRRRRCWHRIFRPDRAVRVATGVVAARCLRQDLRLGARSAGRVRGDHGPRRHSPAAGLMRYQLDRTAQDRRCFGGWGCSAAAPHFMMGSAASCCTDRRSLICSRATLTR